MSEALNTIYTSWDLPFFVVSLITDKSTQAMARKNEFAGFVGYPTAFFDAGASAQVGGYSDPYAYDEEINAAGEREVANIDLKIEMATLGGGAFEFYVEVVCNEFVNASPDVPATPDGTTDGAVDISYDFTAFTSDYESDPIYMQFNWGGGSSDTSEWFGPFGDGEVCTANHSWTAEGTYDITVKAKDIYIGNESDWSAPTSILIHPYVAGDASGDDMCNIIDCSFLIAYLYMQGQMPDPYYAGDANADGIVNIIDISYLIEFLYLGGPPPQYYQ